MSQQAVMVPSVPAPVGAPRALIDATDVEAVVREGACALLARELEGGRKERVETALS